jgi:PPOX class probable F420-dependent enzyme
VEAPRGDAGLSRLAELSNRFYDSIRRADAGKAADGEPGASGFGHLEGHSYCLVVTYRRSGEAVPTPVWFGVDADGRLYFRSYASAAKLRRIANDPRVRIAPCTTRGKPLGPSAAGAARVLAAHDDHAEETIQANYGLFRRVYEGMGGDVDARYVEVTPA